MKHTRRHFTSLLQTGLAVAAAGIRTDYLSAAVPGLPAQFPNARHFSPLVGSSFRAVSQSGKQSGIRLLSVDILTRGTQTDPPTEYSRLRFASEAAELPQGIYELFHPTAGRVLLHLHPGDPGRSLAYLSQVSAEYLASVSIPRKQPALPKMPVLTASDSPRDRAFPRRNSAELAPPQLTLE